MKTQQIIIGLIAIVIVIAIIMWLMPKKPKVNIIKADKKSVEFEFGDTGHYAYVAGASSNPEIYYANNGWTLTVSDFTTRSNPRYEFAILKDGVEQGETVVKKV